MGVEKFRNNDNGLINRTEYVEKVNTIRSSSVSLAKVRVLNTTQSYTQVDVDEVFVDLQCEPFRFEILDNLQESQVAPCLSRINFETIEKEVFNHVVILGLPGAGKTTLLKKVFKEYCKIETIIPIYVELKQEEKRGRFSLLWNCGEYVEEKDIRKYLTKYFEPFGIRGNELFLDFILDEYKIVFFCDGLDEISKEQYDNFTKTVQALSYYASYRFIISSRQVGFSRNDYVDDTFGLFSLMDFDEEKQKLFIEKYFSIILANGYVAATELQERKDALKNSLCMESIQRMAKSPVLLSLLCVMPDINDINNKSQLFQKAIMVLLNSRNIASLSEQHLLIEFLKEIAVIFFKLDKAEHFDLDELSFYAERFFATKNIAMYIKLKECGFNCGLFDKIDDENNAYKFAHRTVWEYLVADGMASVGRDKNEIYNRANMGIWEEPIKMWILLMAQRNPKMRTEIFRELWIRNKALTLSCMSEFEPFPQDDFSLLYGNLTKRDKLRLIATLRDSYVNPSSDYRKQAVNTIKETLSLIHSVERDCEVVYNYLQFLEEFKTERVFFDLLYEFLDYEHLNERRMMIQKEGLKFVEVEPGTFYMGRKKIKRCDMSDEEKMTYINIDEEETPLHKVRISTSFKISQTLITNKMFYDSGFPYLNKNKDGTPVYKGNPYSESSDQPVNYVTWYEAMVFAKWLGCTLATEAEWEYACRSCGKDDSICMNAKLCEMISFLDNVACYASRNVGHPNRTRSVFPINKYHANSLGLIDMLGNLREWCLDWYSDDFYMKCSLDSGLYPDFEDDIKDKDTVSYYFDKEDCATLVSPEISTCVDVFTFDKNRCCVDPVKRFPGKFEAKSLRGGCFDWNESNLRPTYRNHNPANNVYKVNGFRLVLREEK